MSIITNTGIRCYNKTAVHAGNYTKAECGTTLTMDVLKVILSCVITEVKQMKSFALNLKAPHKDLLGCGRGSANAKDSWPSPPRPPAACLHVGSQSSMRWFHGSRFFLPLRRW